MDSETSLQQSAATPKHCANGCGFFGTEATMNLCSKCYKGYLLKAEQSTAARVAVKRSLSWLSSSSEQPVVEDEQEEKEKKNDAAVAAKDGASSKTAVASNRCGCCRKKVGMVGFVCKCGNTYCGSHRYPEEHQCTYDYKAAGRVEIAKALPLIVADKLQKL